MATLDDLISQLNLGTNIGSFGDAMGAASHFSYGQTAKQSEDFQAEQLRQQAGQSMASGQRQAQDVQLQSQLIASRALAVAGASGGGASDPGVVALMARNAQIAGYKQQAALYQGEDKARALNLEASAKEFQGKETALNSDIVAGSQVLKAGANSLAGKARVKSLMMDQQPNASMFQRFGQGSPGQLTSEVNPLYTGGAPVG